MRMICLTCAGQRYNTSIKIQWEQNEKLLHGKFKGGYSWNFIIDTANVDDIRKANDMGINLWCYHNPSLHLHKEGRDFNEVNQRNACHI